MVVTLPLRCFSVPPSNVKALSPFRQDPPLDAVAEIFALLAEYARWLELLPAATRDAAHHPDHGHEHWARFFQKQRAADHECGDAAECDQRIPRLLRGITF
jgi:hypothetical protein